MEDVSNPYHQPLISLKLADAFLSQPSLVQPECVTTEPEQQLLPHQQQAIAPVEFRQHGFLEIRQEINPIQSLLSFQLPEVLPLEPATPPQESVRTTGQFEDTACLPTPAQWRLE